MLDCDTPKGKTFIQNESRVADFLEASYGWRIAGYEKSFEGKTNHADRLILREVNGSLQLEAIAEIKSRKTAGDKEFNLEYLKKAGTYLITHEKLLHGQSLSRLHKVPFCVIVDLMLDSWILSWKVTDRFGEFRFDFDAKETKTQDTCNGGVAMRENAFLPLNFAKKILKNGNY